ncbi:MAG: hypothetical protein HYT70_02980 [Candidatus Aenigmarchaeota archaeon]|nr:hypothetical protein [Candidatus Aenigmarchaeota archaeon]
METQRILKPANKIVILADYREREVAEQLKKLGAVVNELNLKVGDFVCSDKRIVVERKTHGDFVSSIVDGRIFEQMRNMKENYDKPIVIIEGRSSREISDNALNATIASLITKFNASFISTKSLQDTAAMIYWIAKKEQEDGTYSLGFKQGKKPKDIRKLQEFILSGMHGVSNILAKRLLAHFGNIENVVNAPENELVKVKGVGRKLANNIKKLLTTNYS